MDYIYSLAKYVFFFRKYLFLMPEFVNIIVLNYSH